MAACAAPGDDPEFPPSAVLLLEGFIGGGWVLLHTEAITVPTASPASLGESYTVTVTGSATFSAELSCDLRIRIAHRRAAWTPQNTGCRLTTTISLTDWRLTKTDTAVACSGSSGTGGTEPDPGGSGDGCGCEWTETAPISSSFTEVAPVASGFAETAPVSSTWTARECH